MKTRVLKSGRTVTLHDNNGLRKRCDCPRRAWASCSHPWHFSFKWKKTPEVPSGHHRFPLDRYAANRIITKDDARTEAERLRIAIRGGHFPPLVAAPAATADALSFEQFTTKWRERHRAADPKVGESQRLNDRAICTRLGNLLVCGERLAVRPIGRITEDDIEEAFAPLATLRASTWNKYRDTIRMLQAWGEEKGYLARPWVRETNKAVGHRSEQGDKRTRRLAADVLDDKGKVKTPGEERRLLEKASAWLQRLIIAALETGCRRGELLPLQWGDVNLSRGLLNVRGENAKSGKSRQIPISQRLRGILAMIDCDPNGRQHPSTAFVFGDRIGRQVKDPKKAWATCCTAADITGLRFHDLRHEAGSRMMERGFPLPHVQAILGHESASTTSRYLNASVEHLLDSMKRFGVQSLHDFAQTASEEPPPTVQPTTTDAGKVLVN